MNTLFEKNSFVYHFSEQLIKAATSDDFFQKGHSFLELRIRFSWFVQNEIEFFGHEDDFLECLNARFPGLEVDLHYETRQDKWLYVILNNASRIQAKIEKGTLKHFIKLFKKNLHMFEEIDSVIDLEIAFLEVAATKMYSRLYIEAIDLSVFYFDASFEALKTALVIALTPSEYGR